MERTDRLGQTSSCDGCALQESRREFLQDIATALGAVAVTLGIPRSASALAVRYAAESGGKDDIVNYPVPAVDGVLIDKPREVILVRWEGSVYAFRLSCPHQRTALKWKEGDRRFQCPKHKSRYQPDGTFISGRATRGMDRYAITRQGENVRVDVTRVFEQDKDMAGWTAAVAKA